MPCSSLNRARNTPLAAAAIALFGLSAAHAYAANIVPVSSCSDGGTGDTGNLRNAVAGASNGDTIDMTGLTCSLISLGMGEIVIAQDALTIQGPGMSKLVVSGQNLSRVFHHAGSGTAGTTPSLTLDAFTIAAGKATDSSTPAHGGGCIYSKGNLSLTNAYVSGCTATTATANYTAAGGGIYTRGSLTLDHSKLAGNQALGTVSGSTGAAGGAWAHGGATIAYSTIESNVASGVRNTTAGQGGGEAGGVVISGNAVIRNSTIAGNAANTGVGGIVIGTSSASTVTATVINSTISGNSVTGASGGLGVVGGILLQWSTANLYNSTIAYNTAATNFNTATSRPLAAGLAAYQSTVNLESTLLTGNSFGSSKTQYDWSKDAASTVSGNNNLIHATSSSIPAGTLTGAAGCPLLGPLRNNGGPTSTHALMSHSPGIDAGNHFGIDPVTHMPPANDQRGSPFVRVYGAAVDIGAYEVLADIIFNSGFEGCP